MRKARSRRRTSSFEGSESRGLYRRFDERQRQSPESKRQDFLEKNEDSINLINTIYKKDFDISVLGPVGDKVENWKVKGAYIKTAQFGDMDWSVETQAEIQLTIGLDYAVLEY